MSIDPADSYDRIEASYLSSWCRLNPESALDAGVEDYAGELSPCDDESLGIQIVLNEKSLAALDEIDRDNLDAERQLHHQILYGWNLLEHHELLEHDWRYRQPGRFLPIDAIHQLTIRPLENFNQALLSRLSLIPQRLRNAKTYLSTAPALIPPVWLDMARQECLAGIDFFHQLPRHPKVRRAIERQDNIEAAINEAGKSLESFHHLLERLDNQARGDFSCGREHFDRLLQYRHFLPINSRSLLKFGENLFDQTQQLLLAEIEASGSSMEAVRAYCPAQDQLLSIYQDEMQAAREFVAEKHLVTIPGRQHLNVVDTPQFLQHQIPFAAYLEPSIADMSQSAFYYVTPVSTEDELQEHNFAAIAQTSIHEAWPGHHLQFVTANQSQMGSSLIRRLFPCASLYEGWALYCEQMMLEQGYERYRGQKLIMLRDRLWRALRIIIDVNIHTGVWTLKQAAQQMVDKLGFSQHQAESECNWYSQAPTVPMSYAVGWALINALRDIVQPSNTDELREFHDKLLACGSIALPLVIQHQFGPTIWQQCCQHVFGES